MDSKPTTTTAGNVMIPAYLTFQQKGYAVRCKKMDDSRELELWYAENEAIRLLAGDPLHLLGLAALFETRGNDWNASDTQIEDFIAKYGE